MRRSIRFGLLLCVLFHAALTSAATRPRVESLPADAASPADGGIQRLPSMPSSAYPYYKTLKQYTFDNAGAPDTQGWTTADLTAQTGTYWHVDDFSGLSGWAPLAGAKSMWCGIRAPGGPDPAMEFAPGYGDNWTQILECDPVPVLAGQGVKFEAKVTYDVEASYDHIDVEYKSFGVWTTLASLSGTQLTATPMQWNVPGGSVGSTIQFRIVMVSDYFNSDESGIDTHGAIVVDDLRVANQITDATYNLQTFESAGTGSTSSGIWHGMIPPAFGNYAGLVNGSGVVQNGTPDNTYLWSFFNGSTATYACGGYPGQTALPYTSVPGSTHSADYLHNDTRSPWIDLSVDANNQPVDPNMGAVCVELDLYSVLPAPSWVAYGTRWRFMVNGVVQPWVSGAYFYNTSGWFGFTTLRETAPRVIPAGATHAQLSLIVLDYAYFNGATGTCHSQAPLVDNVRVSRLYTPMVVFNTSNSGVGSLRQAITNANANPDFNSIVFMISGAGPHSINVISPLPAIVNPLWIDGFSEAGSSPNTQQGATDNAVMKIMVHGADAGVGANGLDFQPGGYGVVRGMVISAFSGAAIRYASSSLTVNGCFLGTDHAGTTAYPNGAGILALTQGMDIGGVFNEERMLISASTGDAIDLMAGGSIVFNTHIGYDAYGYELANGDGIHVFGGANTQLGPITVNPCDGEFTNRNWIEAGNIVVHTGATGVGIYQTRFDGGYIDLGADGPGNANDPGDVDAGANNLQNYPVLTSADGGTILGTLDSAPSQTYRVEFFSGDGFGGVWKYLGYRNTSTDGAGHGQINFQCGQIPPGSVISATAATTTGGANTSEFGAWITSMNTLPANPGPNVLLYDPQGLWQASVKFDAVSAGGNTFLTPTTPSVLPNPMVWNVGFSPQYWDITTTATYSGNIHVSLNYNPGNIPGSENSLRLLHYQGGQWVDVTDTVDPPGNHVGGTVSSLSPFVLAIHTGATGVGDTPLPTRLALHPNVPNPFNPATTIDYDVPATGADLVIAVFDVSGRRVRTLWSGHRNGGRYRAQWDGADDRGESVASGVYFYRMRAGTFNETRKMVLLK